MDRIRVLRVLEYEGERKMVEDSLEARSIKGTKSLIGLTIREGFIGEFPQVVEKPQEVKAPQDYLSPEQIHFMTRLGWEFPDDTVGVKIEHPANKIIAHEGDETWDRDLRVVREQT